MFVISKMEKESLIEIFKKEKLRYEIDVENTEWYAADSQPIRFTAVNTQSYVVTIGGKHIDFDYLCINLEYYSSTPVAVAATFEKANEWIESTGDHDAYSIDEVPDISHDEIVAQNLPT